MAAGYKMMSLHGAAGATENQVDSTTFKFKRADNDTNNTANPIPKPASGSEFSWRKSFRLKIDPTPDGDVSNLRWYTDAGSWGTGVKLWAHTMPFADYTQGSSGDESAVIDDGTGSMVSDAASFTSGAPLVVNAGAVISNPSTGYGTQDMIEAQLEVMDTAARGTKGPRTVTYRVDET